MLSHARRTRIRQQPGQGRGSGQGNRASWTTRQHASPGLTLTPIWTNEHEKKKSPASRPVCKEQDCRASLPAVRPPELRLGTSRDERSAHMAGERTDRGGPWGGGTARWKGRKSGARLTSLRCRATLDTASGGSDDAVSTFWLMSDRNQSEGRRGGAFDNIGKERGNEVRQRALHGGVHRRASQPHSHAQSIVFCERQPRPSFQPQPCP
ncbi:hypothetical protein B0J12DRAFT_102798 [Macrophomina phaseolina]|uniref:Uncharacterized protein n=1 Tax=Macrophomina phaseolina TaxID=35725 RepID=A0ABQ8GCH1_9PEZI|nr:hypothetical protein B0J12DRAFT_102798 [Macrophomina phaseolina]